MDAGWRGAARVDAGHVDQMLGHRPSTEETRHRHRGHRLTDACVHVTRRPPWILGDIAHIGPVDYAPVGGAVGVPRRVGLVPAQGDPGEGGPRRETHLPAVAAEEGDQRRRVDRARHIAARAPRPAAADPHPPAVVRRGEAPGRVIDPCPAPGPHIGPAAVPVGGPADRDVREPDPTVGFVKIPATVIIEISDPDEAHVPRL